MKQNNEEKKFNDRLEAIIAKEIRLQFYKKFLFQKDKIDLKSIYEHIKNEIGFFWLKEKPFMSKARKIYNRYKQQLYRIYTNEDLVKLQKRYPSLQIFHTYAYFVFEGILELKKSDIKRFKLGLEILLKVMIAQVLNLKNYKEIREKHDELKNHYISKVKK